MPCKAHDSIQDWGKVFSAPASIPIRMRCLTQRKKLYRQRWPNGFTCSKCQGTKCWTVHRSGRTGTLYEYSACGHQDSITAGTIFHRTKVPLRVWFVAIFLIAVHKGGTSALALSRELGLRYATAWLLHHKIPLAMTDRNAQYQLGGLVELDDAYFGGVSHGAGKRGRGTAQDSVVIGVSLNEKDHPQSVFLEAVESVKKETGLDVLKRRVEPYGVWLSDGADIYAAGAKAHEADHRVTLSTDPEAPEVFHWVNTVISLAKTFIDGTYHGRGRARRQLYLEEFTYRLNRWHMGTRIADRLLVACLSSRPPPNAT
ncbi:MAG: IS1595 family transposase [Sulfobacillus acidophilus]|uniref:IS1595 family transposase n=1 Tax=Sulfobacillus acidophilus TaxID=53633 RepID=A0A2T2WEE0_9FIRM|nr:MAG: IS1595 family transposase [Sulfobacillus acidophilus]